MAKLNYSQIQALLRQVGFSDIQVNANGQKPLIALMSAISMQESGGNTEIIGTIAKGKEYSVGLFQINTLAHKNYTAEQLKNPVINTQEALRIYKTQGLRAWGGYTDGGYKKYYAEALRVYNNGATNSDTTTTPTVDAITNNFTKEDSKINNNNTYAILGIALIVILASR